MKRKNKIWKVVLGGLFGAMVSTGVAVSAFGGSPRFVNNQDGTITDNQTGLMWEKKVAGGSGQNCIDNLHGVEAACDWHSAMSEWLSRVNGLSDKEDGSDQKGLGGHTDWRLPSWQSC